MLELGKYIASNCLLHKHDVCLISRIHTQASHCGCICILTLGRQRQEVDYEFQVSQRYLRKKTACSEQASKQIGKLVKTPAKIKKHTKTWDELYALCSLVLKAHFESVGS